MSFDNKIDEALRAMAAHLLRENEELTQSRKRVAESRDKFIAENERLRNRIAKLQSMGAVDVDALKAKIEKLTEERNIFRKSADEYRACEIKQGLRIRAEIGDRDNVNTCLRTQIDELTKHNHELAERAKRAEAHSESVARVAAHIFKTVTEAGQ